MKIISKHKDYYDYLVGQYGIDEIMVYDRRFDYAYRPEIILEDRGLRTIDVAICGQRNHVKCYKGNFYHTVGELLELNKILLRDKQPGANFHVSWLSPKDQVKAMIKYWGKENFDTDINYKQRQPVLIENLGEWHPTLLKDYGFPKWFSAEEMYQKIYAFISWLKDNPEIPNKQTNTEKIVSHGFDLKKSFRHRAK